MVPMDWNGPTKFVFVSSVTLFFICVLRERILTSTEGKVQPYKTVEQRKLPDTGCQHLGGDARPWDGETTTSARDGGTTHTLMRTYALDGDCVSRRDSVQNYYQRFESTRRYFQNFQYMGK